MMKDIELEGDEYYQDHSTGDDENVGNNQDGSFDNDNPQEI